MISSKTSFTPISPNDYPIDSLKFERGIKKSSKDGQNYYEFSPLSDLSRPPSFTLRGTAYIAFKNPKPTNPGPGLLYDLQHTPFNKGMQHFQECGLDKAPKLMLCFELDTSNNSHLKAIDILGKLDREIVKTIKDSKTILTSKNSLTKLSEEDILSNKDYFNRHFYYDEEKDSHMLFLNLSLPGVLDNGKRISASKFLNAHNNQEMSWGRLYGKKLDILAQITPCKSKVIGNKIFSSSSMYQGFVISMRDREVSSITSIPGLSEILFSVTDEERRSMEEEADNEARDALLELKAKLQS